MQPLEGTSKTFNSGGDFGMEKLSKVNELNVLAVPSIGCILVFSFLYFYIMSLTVFQFRQLTQLP